MINQEYIDSHPEQFKDFQQEFDNLWFGNLEEYFNHDAADYANIRNIALHFINWQYEQFEKNRLAACDNMTKEEADREQEFTTDFIEKNHRIPTYSDAIEYGRKTAFEDAVEWLENELYAEKVNTLYPPMSIVISKSYESVDEFIQGFKNIN